MAFIIALIVFAVAVGVILLVKQQIDAVRNAWQHVADELGLDVESVSVGRGKLVGSIGNFAVTVEVTGSGDSSRTRYRVDYPPQTAAFNLRRESGGQRILKRFGIEDREMGDPEFDAAFIVHATHPEELKTWLTASRRSSLMRLLVRYPGLLVSERRLEIATGGVETDPDDLVTTVRRMLATAEHLAGAATAPHLDRADELRRTGNLMASLEALNLAVDADPTDVDAHLLRAETALSAGQPELAQADIAAIASTLRADPEVRGVRELASRPVPPAVSPAPPEALDPSRMFDRIFGESRLSFETDELFAREYRGRSIELTGVVRSARRVDEDLDFGPGPKAKVVATVAAIESDLYGNTAIDAVVELPAAAAQLERGAEITFAGTLLRVDPMMRNVYVSEAQLR